MKNLKLLFTALLLLCCVGMAKAHDFEAGGIYYNILSSTKKTVEVTYRGSHYSSYDDEYTGSVVIPESVTYNGSTYSVTSIEEDAFYYCKGLTSITIPNSVKSIGKKAFRDCYRLTSVTIGNSVTSIGEYAFRGCTGLKSVTIPNSVKSIGREAFYGCSGLTSVEIGNSVTSIGYDAFYGCTGLTSIEIPNSVTSIGLYAFSGCSSLTAVHISDLAAWCGIDFASANANPLCYAKNLYLNGEKLTELVIPDGVVEIKNYTFYNCNNLTSVEIPNSVTSIGEDAFEGCTGLTSITIPNSVTSIGRGAFSGTAWYDNQPDGVVYAGKVLYEYKGEMPENTSITIKEGTLCIGDYAFSGCTRLTSITIPNSVTSIGERTFRNCSGLTSITIPNSVTSIGEKAFSDCSALKTIYNFSNLTFSKDSSDNGYVAYYADKVYNLPEGFIENDFVLGKVNGVNTLVGYLGNATELTLPANYKGGNYTIGANVFKGNTTITSITIPNSVTSIGEDAFYNCSGLTSITIPNSVTSIGKSAFAYCTGLTSVEIPNSVTSIGVWAFEGCTSLTAVHISDLAAWCGIDFASADANPLYYAKNLYLNGEKLTELTIPDGIVEIKNYTFYNCNGVTNIDIIDGVKSIGNSAFYGCNDLETLYISNTIESIGNNAFAKCNNILDIKPGSKKAITANENIFSTDTYNNACLYVPTDRKFAYEKTAPWSNFYIAEMDFTGIEELKSENGKVKTIYDLNGRAVENPAKGIYIINGKKVLIK